MHRAIGCHGRRVRGRALVIEAYDACGAVGDVFVAARCAHVGAPTGRARIALMAFFVDALFALEPVADEIVAACGARRSAVADRRFAVVRVRRRGARHRRGRLRRWSWRLRRRRRRAFLRVAVLPYTYNKQRN